MLTIFYSIQKTEVIMMKVALLFDSLNGRGGAERNTLSLAKILNADIYTCFVDWNNIDGLLFSVGNYYSLSKCLVLLLNDDTLRLKFSVSGRRFAEKFDWRSVAEDTKSIYERLF